MDRQAASILGPYLARDENLLWAGRPNALHYGRAGIGWRFGAAVAIVVIIAIGAAGLRLDIIALPQAPSYRFALAILALALLIGALRVLAIPVERYLEAKQVAYGLSERRAIIIVEGRHSRIEEFPVSSLDKPRRRNLNASLATIQLDKAEERQHRRSFVEPSSRSFIAVREADALMSRLNEVQNAQTASDLDRQR